MSGTSSTDDRRTTIAQRQMTPTPQEHFLMMLFFMKPNQSIKVLIDGLKSRGFWVGDDPQEFQFSDLQDVESNAALFDEVKENYLKLAEELGIQTGSENLGQLTMDWFRPS